MPSFYINKSEGKDFYHGNETQALFGENWEAARQRSFWRDLKATREQEKQIPEHPFGQEQGGDDHALIYDTKSFWFANSSSLPCLNQTKVAMLCAGHAFDFSS